MLSTNLMGYKIIEDKNLVIEDGTDLKYVDRTWKERLFTKLYGKKWNPLRKRKLIKVIKYKPDLNAYVMEKARIIMIHPSLSKKLREQYRILNEIQR